MKKLLRSTSWALAVASLLIGHFAQAATIGRFTGGDAGEGLDLDGNFLYAVNVGTAGAVGKVRDADFTSDDAAGVNIIANNEIRGWHAAAYGDTDNDKNIAKVMQSIRWSAAPEVVTVKLRVEKGIEYKLQLLFAEDCCANRGFNLVFDGKTDVTNFQPGPTQVEGEDFAANKTKGGAVVTHAFKATSDEFIFLCDGPGADAPEITDHNAILNGFTLERITPVTDDDKDGLKDDWEKKYFGDLAAIGSEDADADGLTNLEEQTLGTDPKKADTDGDGINDGEEVKKYKTSATLKDSDLDGISDGDEVTLYKTNPAVADTDGDGTNDGRELGAGTNALDKNSKPILTTIGTFKGGDVDEGLDLDGNFLYALALGAGDDANVKIRDAQFAPLMETEVAGATLQAKNSIANWYRVNYGDSPNDVALAAATSSIRWSPAADADLPYVQLTLENFEVGGFYKFQLMFGEECCDRGFDVFFDDKLVAKDFNPGRIHGGSGNHTMEALLTQLMFAKNKTVVIRLDGRAATTAFGDHNAIFNAITVEKLAGKVDSDADGLPDEWEKLVLGNLSQDGKADPEKDGLTNAEEFELGTSPNSPDSDGDGLNDGAEKVAGTNPAARDTDGDGISDFDEINTTKTDPIKADGDADGLNDGDELRIHKTNPLKADTDGDGIDDGKELASGTDPLKFTKPTEFGKVTVGSFTGGDPGEGLDLQGKFVYAVNVSSAGAAGKAYDADFTADNAVGVKVTAANNIPAWSTPAYGDSPADLVVGKVTSSIRYAPVWRVELANLVPGSTYKLQLLFYEQCCAGRGFNISADGTELAQSFLPAEIQGGVANSAAGAVLVVEFTTYSDKLVVVGDGPAARAATPDLVNDTNAILDGFTLEVIKEAQVAKPITISKSARNATGFSVTFGSTAGSTYILEYKQNVNDKTWTNAGQVTANADTTTLTDTNTTRTGGSTGFYRVRTP